MLLPIFEFSPVGVGKISFRNEWEISRIGTRSRLCTGWDAFTKTPSVETLEKFPVLCVDATGGAVPIDDLSLDKVPQTLHMGHEASSGLVRNREVVMKEGQMVSITNLSVVLA